MAATMPTHLDQIKAAVQSEFGNTMDLIVRTFATGSGRSGLIVCFDGLAEGKGVETALNAVTHWTNPPFSYPMVDGDPITILKESLVGLPEVKVARKLDEVFTAVLQGQTAIFLEGAGTALLADTRYHPGRSVDEPATEAEVRAARDGFVENIILNITLVRRRIRDPKLRFEPQQIGRRTRTDVALAYIEDLADAKLVAEARRRLQRIEIDAVLGTGQIEELIRDSPLSPFATVAITERPDRVSAALLEGRVVIMLDNTPFCLMLPTVFWEYVQTPGDYQLSFLISSFLRLLRLIAILTALTLPSLYVILTTFHHEMIPTPLALSVAGGREGTPLPTLLEVLGMEITFEIIQEAGLRLPRAIGQTVSIVGALVIGEAAVQAGLVSPSTVIVIATAGITGFAIPSFSASLSIRLVRMPLLLLSGTLGVFGFIMGTSILALHLCSLRSFGVPFLSPVAPLRRMEQQDTLVRFPTWKLNRRPGLGLQDRSPRQKQDLMPQPPKGGGSS